MPRRFLTRLLPLTLAAVMALPTTGCVHVGMLVGNLLTATTPELSNGAVQVMFIRNVPPANVPITSIQVVGTEAWRSGGNAIAVTVFKREGVGLYKLDGEVLVDGRPATYRGNGTFSEWVDTLEDRDYVIELRPKAGNPVTFSVRPPAPVKIKSVNGSATGAVVDQSKALSLELDVGEGESRLMRVSMVKTYLPGVSDFMDLAIVKAKPALTLPAGAFAHGSNAALAYDSGSNFLQVEAFEVQPSGRPGVGAAQVVVAAQDTVPVQVVGKAAQAAELVINGKVDFPAGPMTYGMFGATGINTPPLKRARQVAPTSLAVRGTLLKQESNTTSNTVGSLTTTVTTTKTWQFPQLDDALWEQLLAKMHSDLQQVLARHTGGEVLPIDRAMQASKYAELEAVPEQNTEVYIEKTYKGSRALVPTSAFSMLKNVRSTFASDRPEALMLSELGADALLDVVLDVQVGDMNGEVVLRPVLSFRMLGPPNGYAMGTTYVTGTIGGDGVPFTEAQAQTPGGLESIVRWPELAQALDAALAAYAAKQKELDYDAVWALRD